MQTVLDRSATQQIDAIWNTEDPWDYDPAELVPLQLEALRERFHERREQLKVLEQRAKDEAIDHIDTLQDAVPLLFSHTTYKSYPASFIQKGRWDLMNRWLGTLSTQPINNVDVGDVSNVDEWVRALHAAGHIVLTSSGTTGLCSYVNRTVQDREAQRHSLEKSTEVAFGWEKGKTLPFFRAAPEIGWNMGGQFQRLVREIYATPGEEFFISRDDISVAELDRLATMRKAVLDGTATPDLIETAEREAGDRMRSMEKDIQKFFDVLFSYRDRPIYLYAGAAMLWRIVEAGRTRGLKDGAFHPDTIVRSGGGLKGFRGPNDYIQDAQRFLGVSPDNFISVYGMTELNSQFQDCSEHRYHCPPTVIPLILDKSGETVVNQPSGVVEGRGGFFDLQVEGRWGGVISGDRLTVDFSPCACGRKSPSVVGIARYRDLAEGDEKLSCAGQVDAYVRGFTGGDWQS